MTFLYAQREDGTFVIEHNGMPYHLIPGDPNYDFAEAEAEYESLQLKPPQEPSPPAFVAL